MHDVLGLSELRILQEAMEQVAAGMFNYISELEPYGIDESCTATVEVSGSLLSARRPVSQHSRTARRPRHGQHAL